MIKLTKLVYLASAYTYKQGDTRTRARVQKLRYQDVTKAAGILTDRYGYAFILPITQSYQLAQYMKKRDGEFKAWETIDLTFISKCDEVWVYMNDGWKESVGVRAEIEFAHEIGTPVRYINPQTLRFKKSIQTYFELVNLESRSILKIKDITNDTIGETK